MITLRRRFNWLFAFVVWVGINVGVVGAATNTWWMSAYALLIIIGAGAIASC